MRQPLQFADVGAVQTVFDLLKPLCDIIAVGLAREGETTTGTAFFRRSSTVKMHLPGIEVGKWFAPVIHMVRKLRMLCCCCVSKRLCIIHI